MATKTRKQITETKDAAAWIGEVERAAAGADAETRFVRSMETGEHVRQGDVYVVRIDTRPRGMTETQDRQLAPGTTQGSRHVAEGDLTVYRRTDTREVAIGPVVIARKEWRLAHPEHAHMVLPAGDYQIRFQVDERTKRAVQD